MITKSNHRTPGILRTLLEAALLLWAGATFMNFLFRDPPFLTVPGTFLSALFGGRIAFYFEGRIFLPLLRSMVFFALASVPGWIYLRRRIPGVPGWLIPILACCYGWGFWMLGAEILAIFHLLYRWTLILVWLGVVTLCLVLPRRMAPAQETTPPWRDQSMWEKGLWIAALALVAFISYWTFYQALVFPEVYWDSLILYVDYAEQTFLEGGFPVIVCAQVGLGLGANYPHFFSLTAASIGTLWGNWNSLDAQFISPLSALLSCLLIYHLVLSLWGKPWLAMLAVVLFRSMPYAQIFSIFATTYSVAILLTALCLWGLGRYFRQGCVGGLEAAALAAAFGMHLNYLTGILWVAILPAPLLRAWQQKESFSLKAAYGKTVLLLFAVAMLLGSPWYIRNYVVTGNPVYAFFPEIFGGKNINLEVLESCFYEWRSHGDGIGRFGATLGDKLRGLPRFFFLERNFHWKYGCVLPGFALPGLLFLFRGRQAMLLAALIVFLSIVGYHFFIADIYLYHTLMIVPAVALFAVTLIHAMRVQALQAALSIVVIAVGIFAGASSTLVGGKWMTFRPLALEYPALIRAGEGDDWQEVYRERFLQQALRDSWRMWKYLNEQIAPATLLTHENRQHYLRRDIRLMGLDDCGLTDWYDRPFDEVAQRLQELGVDYYLKVPTEDNHPILQRLGVSANLEQYFELVHREGREELYRFHPQGKKGR